MHRCVHTHNSKEPPTDSILLHAHQRNHQQGPFPARDEGLWPFLPGHPSLLRQLHGLLPCFTQASAQTSSPGRPSWIPRPRQDLLSPVTSLPSWTALLTTCHHFLCVLQCICFSVPKARMKLSLSCVTLSRLMSIRLSLPSYKMGTMRTLPHGLSQIQGGMDGSPEHTCSI